MWRTSLAAEYPCGLCMAWANALCHWLRSGGGQDWMSRRSFKSVGKWNNVLVRCAKFAADVKPSQEQHSNKQICDEENRKAVGTSCSNEVFIIAGVGW